MRITDSELTRASARSSTDVVVTSPSGLYSWTAVGVPKPPNRTFVSDRFIATHIMYDRIEPETPISDPTVVRSGLLSMKPSATKAKPLYAFSTVMTTATPVSNGIKVHSGGNLRISAPPIAAVVVYPFVKLRAAFAARAPAAIIGLPGAMVTKAPIVATFVASKPELRKCRPGKTLGLEDIRPPSFKNATMEPVKVIPPRRLALPS